MIKLLSELFIKDHDNVGSPAVRNAYGTLCSILGIALNILLFAGKYIAGIISGSIAITADAFNNLSDAGSSLITLLGFRLSGKKPDPDHPFGHGRIEYISGLVVAGLILIMGFELLTSSLDKIINPEPVEAGILPAAILVASILVKLYMSAYNRSVGKKISSSAMLATATDSLSDSVATTVVLISMLLSYVTDLNIDGYAGVLVALFILFAGYNAAKDTVSPLLGQTPDPEFVEDIERIVMESPAVVGIHDLIVHDYGPGRVIISLHAEVPGNRDVFELHDAIDEAERRLNNELGCCATIHMDPIECDNGLVARKKEELKEALAGIEGIMNIHDFRMVTGTTHTNLIFDVVFPAGFVTSTAEMNEKICAAVKEKMPDCYAVVTIDSAYAVK